MNWLIMACCYQHANTCVLKQSNMECESHAWFAHIGYSVCLVIHIPRHWNANNHGSVHEASYLFEIHDGQVPWGKCEKDFGKRFKQSLQLLTIYASEAYSWNFEYCHWVSCSWLLFFSTIHYCCMLACNTSVSSTITFVWIYLQVCLCVTVHATTHMFHVRKCYCLQSTYDLCDSVHCEFTMADLWHHLTRLETRTKEPGKCASRMMTTIMQWT